MKEIKVDEERIHPLQVNDKTDHLTVKHTVFSLPMRCILCAKSGQGKNTQLLHILCNENMKYNKIPHSCNSATARQAVPVGILSHLVCVRLTWWVGEVV